LVGFGTTKVYSCMGADIVLESITFIGKHVLEFLLRVGLRRLFSVVKFRQNLAGNKNVPCPQERVHGFEDVVNRAVIQVAVMLSQKLHVAQELVAVNLL
jgi:hypothetical protein